MRLFIAITVPEKLIPQCRKLQNLFPDIKKTDDFHITLQFLGNEIKDPDTIMKELRGIKWSPCEIITGDAKPFGYPKNPRGVWIECSGNKNLKELAEKVRSAMKKLGYIESYPFKAHITLGRYKTPPHKRPKPVKGKNHIFTVKEFYLMESHLTKTGPEYKKVAEFKVNGVVN